MKPTSFRTLNIKHDFASAHLLLIIETNSSILDFLVSNTASSKKTNECLILKPVWTTSKFFCNKPNVAAPIAETAMCIDLPSLRVLGKHNNVGTVGKEIIINAHIF